MQIKLLILFQILLFLGDTCCAQIGFSANDKVPEYQAGFRFGTNLGGHQGKWDDLKLATIAAGSEIEGIPGAGCNNLRLSLPNAFLETWGYDIRKKTFNDYKEKLGMSEQTVFLGGPSVANISQDIFCVENGSSKMFRSMYEPIWDNGANGTPVNEKNVFALYVYKTALAYGENVSFWEIFNEPDYTSSDKGWQAPDAADSWWNRDPAPCELSNLLAPVEHYIRALRIAYEVIKFVEPDDFICVGGIGYESFLDAVLRNTDNPDGGAVSSKYPLKGGAYFDVLSYHSYPMYEAREYSSGRWIPMRHSDKAVEVFINGKIKKEKVLFDHGYDGGKFPKKRVIVTETNVPRIAFDNFIGSEKAQYNYLSKIIVIGQKAGIDQIQTYKLTDSKTAQGPYDVTGFYPHLENISPYQQKENLSAVATRNVMQILKGYKYSKAATESLAVPENIDGAAFVKNGQYIYALWAKTTVDNKEEANQNFTFPSAWKVNSYERFNWNYTLTRKSTRGAGPTVQLSASPSFFVLDNNYILGIKESKESDLIVFPNPAKDKITIEFENKNLWKSAILLNAQGKFVKTFLLEPGLLRHELNFTLNSGLYFIKLEGKGDGVMRRLLVE